MGILLRSLAHSNCINIFALTGCFANCVKTGKHVFKRTSYTNTVRFVCVRASNTLSFIAISNRYSRCLGSLFSLVLIAVWIYFNRLQNTGVTIFYICVICCLFFLRRTLWSYAFVTGSPSPFSRRATFAQMPPNEPLASYRCSTPTVLPELERVSLLYQLSYWIVI